MGITSRMADIFKRIHKEILYELMFSKKHSETIEECMRQADENIKCILHYLQLKQSLDNEEKKILAALFYDIKKIYEAANASGLPQDYRHLVKKIISEENDLTKEKVEETEINTVIERRLGELHDILDHLLKGVMEFKYEPHELNNPSKSHITDAMFKMDEANDLLGDLEIIRQEYNDECRLIADVENLERMIKEGEANITDLLKTVGIDPEKEQININNMEILEFKSLLMRIITLTSEIGKAKNQE